MHVAISKWGNSLGIRIPITVTESLDLQSGESVILELKDGGMIMKKKLSTTQMFEQFYGKPFENITTADLGPVKKIEWGEDVGGEII